jgi:hypothetical protein
MELDVTGYKMWNTSFICKLKWDCVICAANMAMRVIIFSSKKQPATVTLLLNSDMAHYKY